MRKGSPKKKRTAPRQPQASKVATPAVRKEPTFDEIRQRAYEIYMRRGGAQGRDVDDWIAAERELRGS
jgi:hypothetical protein